MRWCLVLLVLAVGAGAHAQTDLQVALDRAVKTPLEIVWLQSRAHEEMWRGAPLAAAQQCDRAGAPREGCGIAGRSAWRYVFGNGLQTQATPLFFSEGSRISIAGNGKVYVVPTDKAPMLVLAAGTVVQISDASYPSIHIEIRAPQEEPLSLGNVASADIRNLIAMIARPSAMPASAKAPAFAKAPPPEPLEVAALASGVEVSAPLPEPRFEIAAADLSALSGLNLPQLLVPIAPADPLAATDVSPLAGAIEKSAPLPPPLPRFEIAAADLSALSGLNLPQLVERIVVADPPPVAAAASVQVPAASSDIAKMRAEIEAEIERERARLAQSLQPAGKRFRFGT